MFVKQISTDRLVIGAPAKINLFLEVLNRRPDGFHNIKSLFQAVSLFDRLSFQLVSGSDFKLEITGGSEVPTDERNLVTRAFRLMQTRFSLKGGMTVRVEKEIPVGGGLGGGSADAAATILACKILYDIELDKQELMHLGSMLGSDVPFFFGRGQALVTGRGDVIQEVTLPTDYWILLVTPDLSVGTAESYAGLKRGLTHPDSGFTLKSCQSTEELLSSLQLTGNDFERTHLKSFPILDRVRTSLIDSGALMVRMSGSGSTFFGIYDRPPVSDGGFDADVAWSRAVVRPVILPR